MNDTLQKFMYFLTKDAARDSFKEWLEEREITESDYEQISAWFKARGINLYI